jgi:penicillin-binding protein 1C
MSHRRRAFAVVAGAVIAALAGTAVYVASLGPAPRGDRVDYSHVVIDREGRLLRAYADKDGRWRLPVMVEDVDPRFVNILLSYEDRRFHSHPGVDVFALGRAALQLITHRQIISGGSTITMQVARLLEPRRERSFAVKLRQIVRAVQLERVMTKREILSLYLSLAPYGGNLEGVRAAALAYFGKEPKRLSLGEAALLVALPQSPEVRRPDRHSSAAQAARDRVLARAVAAAVVPRDEIRRAMAELVPVVRRPMPLFAPHASDAVVAAQPDAQLHRLAIDLPLQKALEGLARERAQALGPDMSVAMVAVDNRSGEVQARVASPDYFDARRAGQVDMTHAVRSPGSTLKPFIYGLAFEDGLLHPETLIDDRPIRYGSYAPENFDLTFQGTVTVRKALQLSLNVPAIAVLERVGVSRLASRINGSGAQLVLPKHEAPGLAMGLGGVGITLADLTMLYRGLANGGGTTPLTERGRAPEASPKRLLDPVAAWYVGNALFGTPPPEHAPHGRIAFKTGTSYGFRDAWAVGFDGRMTIGVWVGRPDGVPVPGLVGRAAAAPILFDAFARSGYSPVRLPAAPDGALIASTGKLPLPLQRFRPTSAIGEMTDPPRIIFPPNGARVDLAGAGESGTLALKLAGGAGRLTVLMNGVPLGEQVRRGTVFVLPDGPGFLRLTVTDAGGRSDSVMVRVQ